MSNSPAPLSAATRLAHAGGPADAATGAVVAPVHVATTFARAPDNTLPSAHLYGRPDNQTVRSVEGILAGLEGGADAMLFGSGMAAASAVFMALAPGDHVVAPRAMYWALRGWLEADLRRWGVAVDFADMGDPNALRAVLRAGHTRLVWIETPANPTWEITDIAAIAAVAHAAGARLAVDSTVPTPLLTRPLELGADLVMHSATKYLNGHSDVIAGALVTRRIDDAWERIGRVRARGGAILGPFEAWLLGRGLRTLAVRVPVHCANAQLLAQRALGHPSVLDVLYPGLAHHPGHAVAAAQMKGGFGGMVSIRLKGGEAAALDVLSRVRLFARATSLGGTESLIEHRATAEGPGSSVPRDLLRISVGLEDGEELWADLAQALG
jgi:cystathionine gamma-synthase